MNKNVLKWLIWLGVSFLVIIIASYFGEIISSKTSEFNVTGSTAVIIVVFALYLHYTINLVKKQLKL